jgi:hypothetical protein
MTVGARLQDAIDEAGSSVRRLERDLKARGTRSASYASLHRYLGDTQHPPADVLADIADVLGVRAAWLLTGDGPRTDADAKAERRRLEELLDPDRHDLPYVERLEQPLADGAAPWVDLGTGPQGERRRKALIRFNRKLTDAMNPMALWSDVALREELIAAAATFLVESERAFQQAAATRSRELPDAERHLVFERVLLAESASEGFWTAYLDATLDLFARRVFGLGERRLSYSDAHDPLMDRDDSL